MTAKEIRKTLVEQLGNEEDARNLYKQIKRSLGYKPLNSIWWLKITRNDYKEPLYEGQDENSKVIHFELNNSMVETILTNR